MLSGILGVLVFLTLFCLYGSGTAPARSESRHYDPNDDDFDH